MKIHITWSSGLTEIVEKADCETIEHAIESMFGSAWEAAKEAGVTVVEYVEEALGNEPSAPGPSPESDGKLSPDAEGPAPTEGEV